jgi:RNA polymerase sigma-70 factor (ECF subfamily)
MAYGEIAALLGVPLGTVKAQVHRGRQFTQPLLRTQA